MNKTEISIVKRELRSLKSQLSARAKRTTREIKIRRDCIRATEKEIARIERDSASFTIATSDRLAILQGRLPS